MSAKRTTGPRVASAGPRISNAQPAPPPTPVHLGTDRVLVGAREVDVAQLTPDPHQPRAHMDPERLAELAGSIARHGVLQPLIVHEDGMASDGNMRYTIVAGGRRHAAIRLAMAEAADDAARERLARVPVIVSDTAETEQRVLQLIENIQREDLNPVEEARALKEIQRLEGLTTTGLAARVHRSQGYIDERLRLLRAPEVEEAVEAGVLTPSAGAAVASIRSAEARHEWIEKARAGETIRPREVYASKPDRRTRAPQASAPEQVRVDGQNLVQVTADRAASDTPSQQRQDNRTVAPPAAGADHRDDGPTAATPLAADVQTPRATALRDRMAALNGLGVEAPALPDLPLDTPEAADALIPHLNATQQRVVERVLAAGALLGWSCEEMLRHLHPSA